MDLLDIPFRKFFITKYNILTTFFSTCYSMISFMAYLPTTLPLLLPTCYTRNLQWLLQTYPRWDDDCRDGRLRKLRKTTRCCNLQKYLVARSWSAFLRKVRKSKHYKYIRCQFEHSHWCPYVRHKYKRNRRKADRVYDLHVRYQYKSTHTCTQTRTDNQTHSCYSWLNTPPLSSTLFTIRSFSSLKNHF